LPSRKRLAVNSVMHVVRQQSGHTQAMPMPCVVHGVWIEATGTIILDGVWCDGVMYYSQQLSADELNLFNEELQHAAVWSEF
jgi:hypothetical protein